MTNTTNTIAAPVTHLQSTWDLYPTDLRAQLLAKGHQVVADPVAPTPELPIGNNAPVETVTTPVAQAPVTQPTVVASQPTVSAGNADDLFAEDLLTVDEEEAEEESTRIFLNTTITIGKFEIRIKAAELTSDFHMHNYRDGKIGGKNKYMESLVSTIEKHGLQAVMDKAVITSSLSASGEGLDETVDLLA